MIKDHETIGNGSISDLTSTYSVNEVTQKKTSEHYEKSKCAKQIPLEEYQRYSISETIENKGSISE